MSEVPTTCPLFDICQKIQGNGFIKVTFSLEEMNQISDGIWKNFPKIGLCQDENQENCVFNLQNLREIKRYLK